jgi:hypothetical protein
MAMRRGSRVLCSPRSDFRVAIRKESIPRSTGLDLGVTIGVLDRIPVVAR